MRLRRSRLCGDVGGLLLQVASLCLVAADCSDGGVKANVDGGTLCGGTLAGRGGWNAAGWATWLAAPGAPPATSAAPALKTCP
jgi:hypothetical protein